MTLTFKDPNGVEWDLIARRAYGIKRPVGPADLLSALGQLPTGSDGPTGGETYERFARRLFENWNVTEREFDGIYKAVVDRDVAHYNAGLALGEQKQAARVRELEQRLALIAVLAHDRDGDSHEWRSRRLGECSALTQFTQDRGVLGQVKLSDSWAKRAEVAESELAATKAKLAEVMKRHPGCAAVRAERDAFRADLEQMRDLLPNDWQTQTELGGQVMIELKKQRDEAARLDEKLAEVERERDHAHDSAEELLAENEKLRSELASARRVVEAAKHWASLDHDDGATYRECIEASKKLQAAAEALASAGTPAPDPRDAELKRLRGVVKTAQLVAANPSEVNLRLLALALRIASAGTDACSGCGYPSAKCRPLWRNQRKCCPDCSHGTDAVRTEAPLSERFNPGTSVEVVDFGPRHNQTGHVIGTDSDSVLVRFADGKDESFQANELGVNGPLPSAEPPRPEAGESAVCAACEHTRAWHHNGTCYCGRCAAFDEPTAEPKPEPQPDAPLPLPWRLEFDGTLWSVMSADGQHVADDLREADARYIVDMCNPVGGLRSELRK